MDNSKRISKRIDDHYEGRPDPKRDLRETVNLILPDSLMIGLAIVMIPVVLIPILVHLPESIDAFIGFVDYTVLTIFIIEYFLKLILALNMWKHFLNPWHLLDLFIIIVPAIGFLPFVSNLGVRSPLLRLLRIIRVFAVGGRTLDRGIHLASSIPTTAPIHVPLSIQVMDGELANKYEDVSIDRLKKYLTDPTNTWAHISCVYESDMDRISSLLGIPNILLESELVEESYPRIDYFENYSMIFAREANMQVSPNGPTRLSITRSGLLLICQRQNIITISKRRTELFHQIVEQATKLHSSDDPIIVTILYTILRHILGKDKRVVTALEQEVIALESIPVRKRPSNFLETTFHLRKEASQLVPSLLHLREIISVITSKRVPLEGFSERHEKFFDILTDEATYLHEAAANARDNLQSLVDLHINTTSFETNQVMRIIAVITSLGIIPAVMGLLGSNIIGNPWEIHLWQVFSVLGVLMLAMGWIFFRLGWLRW